ncbi:hypothetical protein WN48_07875 [Eufriesea mexicana]|nr:hypothetical protein WN48_07875 [Eufriesea mexicana]
MDVLGHPPTPQNVRYIFTMRDLLTLHTATISLENGNTIETANALVNKLICRFGAPISILTDQW